MLTRMLVRSTSNRSTLSAVDSPISLSSSSKAVVAVAKKTPLPSKHSLGNDKKSGYKQGRWTKEERLSFLRGLRKYGRSKWRDIATMIPTRDTIQTKTHAQTVMKLLAEGHNIFAELDLAESGCLSPKKEEKKESTRTPIGLKQTTPTFTWKPQDFESAKALIMLKGSTVSLLE